jgi:hypothetical protein
MKRVKLILGVAGILISIFGYYLNEISETPVLGKIFLGKYLKIESEIEELEKEREIPYNGYTKSDFKLYLEEKIYEKSEKTSSISRIKLWAPNLMLTMRGMIENIPLHVTMKSGDMIRMELNDITRDLSRKKKEQSKKYSALIFWFGTLNVFISLLIGLRKKNA